MLAKGHRLPGVRLTRPDTCPVLESCRESRSYTFSPRVTVGWSGGVPDATWGAYYNVQMHHLAAHTKLRVIYVSVKLELKARAAEQQGGEGELWCPV